MSIATKPRRSLASLSLPKKVPALITYAQGIVKAMTGNATFPAPAPTLASVTQAINDLQAAETAVLARTKGAATTRNDKKTVLVTLLQQLRGYVQALADASMDTGAAIIESAGIAVKKTAVRAPRVFDAKQGTVSGTVKLVTSSAGHRASYEWEYSTNGGQAWITMPATLQAKTTLTGLAAGTTVQFRYRAVTKTGEGNWSQPVALLVK
jgi:endoglucanase Acf2